MNINELSAKYRTHEFEHLKAPKARDAAIMIPLVETEEGLSILFEIRSSKIIQGGEVCFPGGRVDNGENPEQTVVREVCEELLVDSSDVEIIAPMFTMNGVGDAFIFSYLGSIRNYKGSYSKDEVGSVFAISIEKLLAMQPKVNTAAYVIDLPDDFHFELIPGGRDYKWRKRPKNYYFYETEYGVIWGMTGEVLYNVIEHFRKNL